MVAAVQDTIEQVAVQDAIERIVVAPDEGKAVDLGGLGVVFKVWGEDTGVLSRSLSTRWSLAGSRLPTRI